MPSSRTKNIAFFTRLLDDVSAADRYRLATEQIREAERLGFSSAWVAQHHFDPEEGGLPAPLVFLTHVAANTSRIRLGTGVITLPLEDPLRVAEDAAVLDLLSNGRLEIGLGTGGTAPTFAAFGRAIEARGQDFAVHLTKLRQAWRGEAITETRRLYPAAPALDGRIWQATFSVEGGRRAGLAGDGLMLSRTQPRPEDDPRKPLDAIQNPIIDAYLEALPEGVAPRILASRSVFVADRRQEALDYARIGLGKAVEKFGGLVRVQAGDRLEDLIAAFDSHLGTPDEVVASLARDSALTRATDVAVQVHSIDPPHDAILRSIELFATRVAPALGWTHPQPQKTAALVGLRSI
ncbi:putative FMN-dependent luciferase-like monooxygenase [Pannonibacter tanglangensis]|uniref:FMN-dependent luciferase-like monooxygenase n=1 Tax=Pannonibacter tanglangensis TaxID=2750084 RepID=A0ABW9ZKC8_9HYPH|nr:putative FMN-dependent luciferase-like monooxygenase [Pannonibacter sp. XCT-34]NBN64771.1 putative FMN-dependent luciferase-like monooxygenase [Pannonibacter sp. XCT-34]